ncbi:hypothetical protein D9M69_380370 [compost metagenome]
MLRSARPSPDIAAAKQHRLGLPSVAKKFTVTDRCAHLPRVPRTEAFVAVLITLRGIRSTDQLS